ncbi:AAA family ATPase [Limibacter armeniacum]|uniref:AAA family ATPase n=1 Tax=Limibacter armeniacum TaxID=466084 RepID=UPI002FE69A72
MVKDLINAFDDYDDFRKNKYFVLCYDTIPSQLTMELPLKENKENMELAIELINPASMNLEVIYKVWNTEDSNDATLEKDYPYDYTFKGKSNSIMVLVELNNNELFVQFLYDAADKALEKWVLETNHKLRSQLGLRKTPIFKVLTKGRDKFDTEEVKADHFEIDLDNLYNDSFKPVDKIIQTSLEKDKAGLILLHGTPGTGKTSYIKSLISQHKEKSFIFVQNEFVQELLDPEFISFLLKHRNAILIIEDAEKVITTREDSKVNSVVSNILQLTDGLFSDYLSIKIICTFNTSIDKIDKALLRKGRMIADYEFEPLTSDKTNKLLDTLGHHSEKEEMTLADIFNYTDKGFEQVEKANKIGF